jgi:hypothetical protein
VVDVAPVDVGHTLQQLGGDRAMFWPGPQLVDELARGVERWRVLVPRRHFLRPHGGDDALGLMVDMQHERRVELAKKRSNTRTPEILLHDFALTGPRTPTHRDYLWPTVTDFDAPE